MDKQYRFKKKGKPVTKKKKLILGAIENNLAINFHRLGHVNGLQNLKKNISSLICLGKLCAERREELSSLIIQWPVSISN